MATIRRVTTAYVEAEDRLRLTGEAEDGSGVVLWMTQRLLARLTPHLCQWLERQHKPSPVARVQQEFAQQRARTNLVRLPPVSPPPEAVATAALVAQVDIKVSARGVVLVFKDPEGKITAQLPMAPGSLRSWVNILHDQTRRAQWSTIVWPEWVKAAASHPGGQSKTSLH